jgi:energy-converting hydrogenase B subunit D
MSTLQATLLIAWAVVGTAVVFVHDVVRQTALVGVMGLLAALTFFSLQAPDVALSMIVVGAIALPVMILLVAARVHEQEDRPAEDER